MSWLDELFRVKGPVFFRGLLALPQRPSVMVLGPEGVAYDDPDNNRTVINPGAVVGRLQETATIGDGSPHLLGTGVDLAADATTTLDAEVVARDASGNRGEWRISHIYDRTGTGAPVANGTVTITSKGTNAGAPPAGWSATIALGSGIDANTAFVQLTGAANWYWYLDGSRYPGDELALLPTVSGVFPSAGPTTGGTVDPTVTSVVPAGGPTSGGP